jgi:hypothetical protein
VATIVFDQTLIHPDRKIGSVSGHDVDYWLDPSAGEEDHLSVAREIIREAKHESGRRHRWIRSSKTTADQEPVEVVATQRMDCDYPQAEGLYMVMNKVGTPAPLFTPRRSMDPAAPEDPYGLTKGGAVLQLYSRDAEI